VGPVGEQGTDGAIGPGLEPLERRAEAGDAAEPGQQDLAEGDPVDRQRDAGVRLAVLRARRSFPLTDAPDVVSFTVLIKTVSARTLAPVAR